MPSFEAYMRIELPLKDDACACEESGSTRWSVDCLEDIVDYGTTISFSL